MGKQKVSCKGISKRNLTNAMTKFTDTLWSTNPNSSTNTGFRLRNSEILTYSQEKIGFNYFYCTREVLSDGINTKPLNLILTPWKQVIDVVEKVQNPMSNLYYLPIFYKGVSYNSTEQMYYHLLAEHHNNRKLSDEVLKETDPLNIAPNLRSSFTGYLRDIPTMITVMTLCIREKLKQSLKFREGLQHHKGRIIIYKQPNYNQEELAFWGGEQFIQNYTCSPV